MKIWVDDLRPPPSGWVWAETSAQALALVRNCSDALEEVSFDHDLGGDDTSRAVVLWMCEHAVWPDVVRVHTANPVGRQWLVGMVERYGPGVTS